MDTKTSPVSPKCQRRSSFVVGNIVVLVNPLSATPLFSPSWAALFGLVVFMPRGRKVAKPKICRKAPVIRQCTIVPLWILEGKYFIFLCDRAFSSHVNPSLINRVCIVRISDSIHSREHQIVSRFN
jgi:hypothetical protein